MGVTPRTFAPYVSGSPEHSFRRRHRWRFRGAEQASSPLSVSARLFAVRHRLPSKSLASPFRAFCGYAPHRRVLSPGRRSGQTGSACLQTLIAPPEPLDAPRACVAISPPLGDLLFRANPLRPLITLCQRQAAAGGFLFLSPRGGRTLLRRVRPVAAFVVAQSGHQPDRKRLGHCLAAESPRPAAAPTAQGPASTCGTLPVSSL